jgi:signal transduction histidine kinase
MMALVFFACTIVAAAAAGYLWAQNRRLRARPDKALANIEETSRLLVEKNAALFDQTLLQQKLIEMKDDFLAIASHQFRTPINEIKWSLGELIERTDDAQLRASYEQIFSSARRMEKISEDLLRFVGVDQTHARVVASYDPDALVRATAKRIAEDFKSANLALDLQLSFGDRISSIDPAALEMIASNLLENAYRYTPSPGTVAVTTGKGVDGSFVLEVKDTGIGIPATLVSQLFVKFRRSPAAIERNRNGSGLGLYIIKTLLARAGGTVSCESQEGKGSTFRVSIPRESRAVKPVG